MPVSLKIAVAIPCYKVEQHLEQVVRGLPAFVDTVLLVDDCSPDGTGALADCLAAADPRVTVLHHETNRGVGGAMKTAFRKAMELGVDAVVKLDGDGQMDPAYIEPLVKALDGAEFAKGNRLFDRQMLRAIEASNREKNRPLNDSLRLSGELPVYSAEEEGASPEMAFIDRELKAARLEKLSGKLSALEREVLSGYLDGLSLREIAYKIGKPPKTVDNAFQRIRRKCRNLQDA